MADYIENKKTPVNTDEPLWNCTICPPCINQDQSSSGSGCLSTTPANWLALWEAWKNMSDDERNMLFYPLFHFVNMEDIHRKDFDKYLTKDVYEFGWKHCRSIMKIDYELSRQAIPMYAIIYAPIDPSKCIIQAFREELERWRIYHI